MIDNIILKYTKLYDGLDLYQFNPHKNISIIIKKITFDFNYKKIKSIEELINLIDQESFTMIMKKIKAKHHKYFDSYNSKNGLSLYYILNETGIGIFSYGELQPGRYQLFFEAFIKN